MSTFCPVNYPVLEIATARSLQTEPVTSLADPLHEGVAGPHRTSKEFVPNDANSPSRDIPQHQDVVPSANNLAECAPPDEDAVPDHPRTRQSTRKIVALSTRFDAADHPSLLSPVSQPAMRPPIDKDAVPDLSSPLPPAITPARRPPSDDDAVPPHPSLLSSAREYDSSSSYHHYSKLIFGNRHR